MNTHGLIVDFGKHKGTRYTRMPVSYLLWMVNSDHSRKEIAQAELDRRGTVSPTIDISGHAVNRASLNCLKDWRVTQLKDEGIYSWLARMGAEALKGEADKKGRYEYFGLLFAFDNEGEWPVLKTVMKRGKCNGKRC